MTFIRLLLLHWLVRLIATNKKADIEMNTVPIGQVHVLLYKTAMHVILFKLNQCSNFLIQITNVNYYCNILKRF